jgi:hypothetical protein
MFTTYSSAHDDNECVPSIHIALVITRMANRKHTYNHRNLHVANLSLDLFLGAVRTEPERQRDFVPIPLNVIDTTGTVVVKAKNIVSFQSLISRLRIGYRCDSRPLGLLLILSRTSKLHRPVLVQLLFSRSELPLSPRPTGRQVPHIPPTKDRGRSVLHPGDRPAGMRVRLQVMRERRSVRL